MARGGSNPFDPRIDDPCDGTICHIHHHRRVTARKGIASLHRQFDPNNDPPRCRPTSAIAAKLVGDAAPFISIAVMSDEELAAPQQPAQREPQNQSLNDGFAVQWPSSATAERACREVAWHLKKPALVLETSSPPRKRCPQEEYRRPVLAIEPATAGTTSVVELDVLGIATERTAATTEVLTPLDDAPVPMRLLSERLVSIIDDSV